MNPAKVLFTSRQGLPFEKAWSFAKEQKRFLASSKIISEALLGNNNRTNPCWSGTMTAYTAPGRPFGSFIAHEDPGSGNLWIFNVPAPFRNETNAILVCEPSDYTLEIVGRIRIVNPAKTGLVTDFPSKSGLYLTDPVHGIPCGKELNSPAGTLARHLWRKNLYVGPVAINYGRSVILDASPSNLRSAVMRIHEP
jgi:hypothetical protein